MRSVGRLVAVGVTKSHGGQVVLADVDFVVPPHARVGLVGPNGVGKSTLLRLLAALEAPHRGAVRRLPPSLAVGHLPQERDPTRRMQQWEERGYGQERKKKKSKDVKKAYDRLFLERLGATRVVELGGL